MRKCQREKKKLKCTDAKKQKRTQEWKTAKPIKKCKDVEKNARI